MHNLIVLLVKIPEGLVMLADSIANCYQALIGRANLCKAELDMEAYKKFETSLQAIVCYLIIMPAEFPE
jgi:hypothetical protein